MPKSVFQVHGVDCNGQVVIRRQLKRFRRADSAFEPSLYQCQSPPSRNAIFQGRDKDPETAPVIQWQSAETKCVPNRRQFGAIRTEPGNLRLCRTAWWARELSHILAGPISYPKVRPIKAL